jgi:hypothetical protein
MKKKFLPIGALAAAAVLAAGWSVARAQDHQGMHHGATQHQSHNADDADQANKKATPKRSAKAKRSAAGAHNH